MKASQTKNTRNWTASELCDELSLGPTEVRRRLRQVGLETGRGTRYGLRDCLKAFAPSTRNDELKVARLEKLRRQEELLALAVSVKRKELVSYDVAESMIRSAFQPIREALLGLPSTLAHRCNPTDPKIARTALTEWLDQTLTFCRERVASAK